MVYMIAKTQFSWNPDNRGTTKSKNSFASTVFDLSWSKYQKIVISGSLS